MSQTIEAYITDNRRPIEFTLPFDTTGKTLRAFIFSEDGQVWEVSHSSLTTVGEPAGTTIVVVCDFTGEDLTPGTFKMIVHDGEKTVAKSILLLFGADGYSFNEIDFDPTA